MRKVIGAVLVALCVPAASHSARADGIRGKPKPEASAAPVPRASAAACQASVDNAAEKLSDTATDIFFLPSVGAELEWISMGSLAPGRGSVYLVMSRDRAALTDSLHPADGTYESRGSPRPIAEENSDCGRLLARLYKKPILENLELSSLIKQLPSPGVVDPGDPARGASRELERRTCADDRGDAALLARTIHDQLRCGKERGRYRDLCDTLRTAHLCEVAANRDLIRMALAADLNRRIVDELRQFANAPEEVEAKAHVLPPHLPVEAKMPSAVQTVRSTSNELPETSDGASGGRIGNTLLTLLRRLPRDTALATPTGVRAMNESILSTITRDALARGVTTRTRQLVAVATVAACMKAEQEGEVERGNCDVAKTAHDLESASASSLARQLLLAQPRAGDSDTTSRGRFDAGLRAAALFFHPGDKGMALGTKLVDLHEALLSKDFKEIFELAIRDVEIDSEGTAAPEDDASDGEPLHETTVLFQGARSRVVAALRALALASTRSLDWESANEIELFGKRSDWSWAFGIGARALGGISGGRGAAFAGPLAFPVGVSVQNVASPGLYADFSLFDPGQYVSVGPFEDKSRFRSPAGLDAFGPAASIGLRWGTSIPFVMAVTGGAARLGADDTIGYCGISIGTFLPLVQLNRGAYE